jgi:hypothetical protein
MSDIKVPDEVAAWAKEWASDPGPTLTRVAAEFIVSLLPPPPEPDLRDKLTSLVDRSTELEPPYADKLVDDILDIVRLDLKENFGWETRITSYLKGQ